jgi:hypothetical protein
MFVLPVIPALHHPLAQTDWFRSDSGCSLPNLPHQSLRLLIQVAPGRANKPVSASMMETNVSRVRLQRGHGFSGSMAARTITGVGSPAVAN